MQAEHVHTGTRANAHGSKAGSSSQGSARLGGARADFVAGLGRKVADLRATLARVKASADDPTMRDELRRKFHALGSAAKMMKFDAMDRGIADALGRLDRSPREAPLDAADLESIQQVIEDLPALAWGDGRPRSSRAESTEKETTPKYAVLVVGSALIAEALLEEDEGGRILFTCETTPDAQAAFDLVRKNEPDLVVLDADVADVVELVDALMDDPLTEAVPLVVVGSFLEQGEAARYIARGVAKTVSKPTSRDALRAVCEETLSPSRGTVTGPSGVLGEPTLEELGERLANELREALVGRADPSTRTCRIPLGQGTEVLGAVWGAIARVREVVTSRSDGVIRFAGGPEGALTPALLLHEPDVARGDRARTPRRGPAAEVRLQGRRVVVADDDPGVVWFLADLLKTAGCIVQEAFDGRQALELAYKSSPDLVISDILMPNLDGFSLCRALRRDVALRDTPVILLSWKEDLLQRVRELGAGAAGYVRKESDTRAIIARVREALRTRGRIEARLREDGEVRGRLDGISIRTLLEIVCATRPEARVSVRDASFLYEVEIRWGAPHRATRTNGSGSFLKGSKVLAQLLGVSAGRFTVTNGTSTVEADLDGNLAAQLAKPIARARAAISLLTGAEMNAVTRIRFDEDALTDYLAVTPERARLVARRLSNGASPRELLLCGGAEPALLDDILCDLAARGFVVAIEGKDGEDMLHPAMLQLLEHTDARAAFAPRTATPAPADALLGDDSVSRCSAEDPPPVCTSPTPGAAASLEDAVLREVSHRSPEPPPAHPSPVTGPPSVVDSQSLRPKSSPIPPACEAEQVHGAPAADEIVAAADATVIDGTAYGESSVPLAVPKLESASAEKDEDAIIDEENMRPEDLTPFASITATASEDSELVPAKHKRWPMIAFIAATGIVAWAVLHFSTRSTSLPPQQQRQLEAPPPAAPLPPAKTASTEGHNAKHVFYTSVAPETPLPADHGVIDVSAPEGTIVLVDGKERARGPAKLPASSGSHDVRVRPTTSAEQAYTIDVRTSRIAHIRFE